MEKNLEIKKLSDIVEWADGKIRDGGYYEEKYRSDATTAYCNVKAYELWKIRDVVLKAMERHAVYTDALNKDIADKAAKIDLLEKELDGRKKAFNGLNEEMANGYIAIETHNDIRKTYENKVAELEKELEDRKVKIRHQKENLDGINKTLKIRTKENERLIAVKNNQAREIEAHESENARLSEKVMEKNESINTGNEAIINLRKQIGDLKDEIESRKKAFNDLKEEMANRYIAIETHNDICKTYEMNDTALKKQVEYLKKELEDTYRTKEADLKNHNKRDMTLVDELAGKNDEIKKLKEENSRLTGKYNKILHSIDLRVEENKKLRKEINGLRMELDCVKASKEKHEEAARDKTIEDLRESFNYWRTKCLAAQEEIEKLKNEKADMEDDHGRAGFKRYIEYLIEEEEAKVADRFKARLNEEITAIFEKEEETEVKGIHRMSSGRYPWGAEVSDIPCGSDVIE